MFADVYTWEVWSRLERGECVMCVDKAHGVLYDLREVSVGGVAAILKAAEDTNAYYLYCEETEEEQSDTV
jgi:hypothetical protein